MMVSNSEPGQTLGTMLRRHRQSRGFSQQELAERAQPALSVDTISKIERGCTLPYRHTLEALADALGMDDHERGELMAAHRELGVRRQGRGEPSSFGELP